MRCSDGLSPDRHTPQFRHHPARRAADIRIPRHGGNTLWCGYLLRSISARPLVAVVVVAVVPSLVGVIPRPGQGMYSMQLASWLPSLPAEVGVGLAIVASAIVFRSVWEADTRRPQLSPKRWQIARTSRSRLS